MVSIHSYYHDLNHIRMQGHACTCVPRVQCACACLQYLDVLNSAVVHGCTTTLCLLMQKAGTLVGYASSEASTGTSVVADLRGFLQCCRHPFLASYSSTYGSWKNDGLYGTPLITIKRLDSCSSLLRDTLVITDHLATLRRMGRPWAVPKQARKCRHGFNNFPHTKCSPIPWIPFTKC